MKLHLWSMALLALATMNSCRVNAKPGSDDGSDDLREAQVIFAVAEDKDQEFQWSRSQWDPPLLSFQLRNESGRVDFSGDGPKYARVSDVLEQLHLRSRFGDKASAAHGSLSWQQLEVALFFYDLPLGDYYVDAFWEGHVFPIVTEHVTPKRGITQCSVPIPRISFVEIQLTETRDIRSRSKALGTICVLRKNGKRASCIWSLALDHANVGRSYFYVEAPCTLEAWLVIKQPSIDDGGSGIRLKDFSVMKTQQNEPIPVQSDSSVSTKPQALPAWAVRATVWGKE